MASTSQALYTDPSMAFDVASTPDQAFAQNVMNYASQQQYTREQQMADQQKVQQDRSGFLGTIAGWLADTDSVLSKVPGWGVTKNVFSTLYYPVDKLARGAHWLYSEAVSQPLSTLIIQSGKANLENDWSNLFSGQEWSEAYGKAEHISPGQALYNVNAAEIFSGQHSSFPGVAGIANIFGSEKDLTDEQKRAAERLMYDSEYWRDRMGWKYTAGTGATDFALVLGADPTTYLTAGVGQVVKGVRSVQLVNKGGELVRTRGAIADTALKVAGKKPETIEEVARGKQMQDFFDWVASPSKVTGAPRKSAAEIEMHPIWGRGRRKNTFAPQYAQALAGWSREEMPLAYRFMAGDASAAGELATRGTAVLDDIGRLSDNRVAVNNLRYDDELLGYFDSLQRPVTRAEHETEQMVRGLYRTAEIPGVSPIDKATFDTWKTAKLDLMNDEITRLQAEASGLSRLLGSNLGRTADDFSAVESHGFGGLARAYRMGSGSFASRAGTAERKYANKIKDRRGRFTTEGFRSGFFGTPFRVVQSFTDRTPQGFVNHNDADAGDRVFEMLREVPGLGPEQRAGLLDRYMTAGDKVAKSQALQSIKHDVVLHMAERVGGLDGEVARVISGMVQAKTDETVKRLLGTTGRRYNPSSQAFSGARREGGRTVDYVEDGEGWVLAPLAKTQLSMTDSLLPVREIERALSRSSGAIQSVRRTGGTAVDAVKTLADGFNGIWKAATLLRPAYVPRMVSEEIAASAIKFGFLSRVIMDGGIGAKNFVLNRGQQLYAELGRGSYVPTTGEGLASSLAVVKIGDENVVKAVNARKSALQKELAKTSDPLKRQTIQGEIDAMKTERIRVSSALPVVNARISMERELMDNLQAELKDYQSRYANVQKSMAKPPTLGGGPGSATATRQGNKLTSLQDKIDDLTMRIEDHQNVLDEFTDYYNEIMRVAVASTGRRLGEGTFEAFGQKIPQAFSKEWANPIPRDQISSESAMSSMFARAEAIDKSRLIQMGSWTHLTPDSPNHMQAWLHALNRQFGQDDLFLKVMEDSSLTAAKSWLKTPAGKQHLADLGIRARNPEQLLEDISLTLDKYLPEDTGLRAKILAGEDVTAADLTNAIAKADFPTVHGEEVAEITAMNAKDTAANVIDKIVQKGYKRLGSIPSDVLSRHPVYVRFQEGRFKELMKTELEYQASLGKSEALTPDQLQKILEKSDQLARKDMSQIVYDPNRTTASEALRFVTPFFSAHADSLARWGGLIAEKPRAAGRLAQIYNAPVSAGLITDEYGNKVGGDGYVDIIDPSTGKAVGREFVSMDKRVFHLRAPWRSSNEGSTPIRISAMNTILPGDPWFNPGAGPLVQVGGSQLAKSSPQIGEFLQWSKVLPYGPSGSTVEALTPKYIRSLYQAFQADDPNNEEYQKAYLAIWNKKQMEYQQSGGAKKFSTKDIENEAKSFLWLNVLEAWGSPAQSSNTPLTGTPYQFFVDQLSQMRKVDPENYRDAFLAKFGTDYGGFTASLSKSMGIAATISADQQAEKYKDEISADPDMAQFWVGDIYNGGPFSSSVYDKQLDQNFGSRMAREKITAEEAIERSQSERGWSEYRAMKTALDSMLIRNGFKSYNQKGAEAYNEARQQVVLALSQKYPAWGDAFMVTDKAKVPNRIKSFEKAVQDKKLMSDPMRYEMQPLGQYLIARREFKAMLASRGASQLSYDVANRPAGQNADIGLAWEQFKMGLINSNVAFGDLYNRYLSNDNLQ